MNPTLLAHRARFQCEDHESSLANVRSQAADTGRFDNDQPFGGVMVSVD